MMKIHIPKFLKRKRNIWIIAIIIVIVLIAWFFMRGGNGKTTIQVGEASRKDLHETVLTTGQVVSGLDLQLGFQTGGVVRKILVKEGDKVANGQLLAYLDQGSALASLTTARGALAQAQANYDKLIAGATQENIQTVQDSVNLARQDLENSYNSALNTLNSAYTSIFNAYYVAKNVYETYFQNQDISGLAVSNSKNAINSSLDNLKNYITIITNNASNSNIDMAISQGVMALNDVYNNLDIIRTQCDQGIHYASVSSTDKTSLDTQKAGVNTSLSSVLTLQNNIASEKITLQKAVSQLSVTKAPPTQAEIDASKAQILSAQGQVDSANVLVNNTVIKAPQAGTITLVDIKEGEQATAMKGVISLQDINNLHAEADVSEANIASLSVDQIIDYTFDALGPDEHFAGKILTINPSSTVVSGVVNYKIKGSLDNVPKIKPGMTANMTIQIAEKHGVLAVPSTSIINKNSKRFVRVIDDIKKKTYHEVEVKTGMEADGGLVEIISGLSEGQKIITYMK